MGASTQAMQRDDTLNPGMLWVLEGEMLWNIAGGHFHSLDLSGTSNFKSAQAMTLKVQGREMKIEQSMEFAGTTTFQATAK